MAVSAAYDRIADWYEIEFLAHQRQAENDEELGEPGARVNRRRARHLAAIVAVVVALGACADDTTLEATAVSPEEETGTIAEDVGQPSSTAVLVSESEEREVETDDSDEQRPEAYLSYEEWKDHELAALVPSPDDLGPGWNEFYVSVMAETTLFDPAAERADCGLDEPVVIRDGLYAELGFGESPDDALVILSRGTAEQIEGTYRGLLAILDCPGNNDLGAVFTYHSPPELPGVVEASRFSVDDELDQHLEGLLLRRADLVLLVDVSEQEGAEPIDVDQLVNQLLTNYDDR